MSWARNRKLIQIAVVFGVLGMGYWYMVRYTPPGCRYESSDRGMADLEITWKGRNLDTVQANFTEYKAWIGDPTVTLCRTESRIWSAPNLWWDNLTNPRWDLPYIAPSPKPNYSH